MRAVLQLPLGGRASGVSISQVETSLASPSQRQSTLDINTFQSPFSESPPGSQTVAAAAASGSGSN